MGSRMPLLIVIPVRNEERRLGPGLARLAESLQAHQCPVVLIVVSDNGSTDGTRSVAIEDSAPGVASALAAGLQVLVHAIGDSAILDPIGEILSQVRRAKTDAKTSQKTIVTEATVSAPEAVLAAFELGRGDLSDAGSVRSWVTKPSAGETTVSAVLAPPEPAS